MKQLVFEYLKSSYSDIHRIRTNLGNLLVRRSDPTLFWYDIHRDMVKSIIKLFSMDEATAEEFIEEWVNSLPYVEEWVNSLPHYVESKSFTISIIPDM